MVNKITMRGDEADRIIENYNLRNLRAFLKNVRVSGPSALEASLGIGGLVLLPLNGEVEGVSVSGRAKITHTGPESCCIKLRGEKYFILFKGGV